MRTRIACLALGLLLTAATGAHAQKLDLKRYMPLADLEPGMTGVGKTTLRGTTILEFQVEILALLKNFGPKRDLIIVQCSGAGLEESGVIAGMSGSPVYVGGRLIGAVAYSFRWCKLPIAGVQPIEQMLRVQDRRPLPRPELKLAAARPNEALAVPAASVAALRLPGAPPQTEPYRMEPIAMPVMVSGLSSRAMAQLRDGLAPFGMVPIEGGAAETDLPDAARLEPGAPLAVAMVRGDIQMTTMGTITEIDGDRLYGFGHSMFSFGEADYPLMTGVGKVVIPSLMNSSRMGAPAKEVGRLLWDEETGVFGRLGDERTAMVPVNVKVTGPAKGLERVFRCEMVAHRYFSPMFSAVIASNSLLARSELPIDHTVLYRVRVKPVGREPIVRDNLTVSPNGDAYLGATVRNIVGQLMDNPFENLAVESIDVEATVEPVSRLAEIEKGRALRNAVRPGGTLPIELKIRPWRAEPKWITVEVQVPEDYPEGTYQVVLCSAAEALRQEMREAPARFQAEGVDRMVELLRRDERRDQLFVRLQAPGQGLAIGPDELPNLPGAMRAVLAASARRNVTGLRGSIVVKKPIGYVLTGGRRIEVTVDRNAPKG